MRREAKEQQRPYVILLTKVSLHKVKEPQVNRFVRRWHGRLTIWHSLCKLWNRDFTENCELRYIYHCRAKIIRAEIHFWLVQSRMATLCLARTRFSGNTDKTASRRQTQDVTLDPQALQTLVEMGTSLENTANLHTYLFFYQQCINECFIS